jgi:hypothetical protein
MSFAKNNFQRGWKPSFQVVLFVGCYLLDDFSGRGRYNETGINALPVLAIIPPQILPN